MNLVDLLQIKYQYNIYPGSSFLPFLFDWIKMVKDFCHCDGQVVMLTGHDVRKLLVLGVF